MSYTRNQKQVMEILDLTTYTMAFSRNSPRKEDASLETV